MSILFLGKISLTNIPQVVKNLGSLADSEDGFFVSDERRITLKDFEIGIDTWPIDYVSERYLGDMRVLKIKRVP